MLSLWLVPFDCNGATPLASHFLLLMKLKSFLGFPADKAADNVVVV